MLYEEVVESAEQTCYACPAQWEGILKDGRAFYFRYRGGVASLGIGASRDAAVADEVVWMTHGDTFDGYMETDEFHDVFGLLYNKHEKLNPWVVTASHAFSNGEISLEVWGTFLTKSEADAWIENNREIVLTVGENVQVKELLPVEGPTILMD